MCFTTETANFGQNRPLPSAIPVNQIEPVPISKLVFYERPKMGMFIPPKNTYASRFVRKEESEKSEEKTIESED